MTESGRDPEAPWTLQTTTNNQVDPKDQNLFPPSSLPVMRGGERDSGAVVPDGFRRLERASVLGDGVSLT